MLGKDWEEPLAGFQQICRREPLLAPAVQAFQIETFCYSYNARMMIE